MRLGGIRELVHAADDRLQPARLDQVAKLVEQGAVRGVHQHAVHDDVPVEHEVEVAREVDDGRSPRPLAQPGEAAREAVSPDEIDDRVQLAACPVARGLNRIVVVVVDCRGGAELQQQLMVRLACERNRPAAGCSDELDCEQPDPASAAVDEHAIPGPDPKAPLDQRVRRTARQGHRRSFDVGEIRRFPPNGVCSRDMELGVRPGSAAPERGGAVDLVAATPLQDVISDSVDDARKVGAKDRLEQTQVFAQGAVNPVADINGIDARGVHGDSDVVRPGNWVGHVTELEHAWATEAADDDGAHSTRA